MTMSAIKTHANNVFAFVYTAMTAALDKPNGEIVKFTCPCCNGTAQVIKSVENGKYRASCSCGMKVIE